MEHDIEILSMKEFEVKVLFQMATISSLERTYYKSFIT